MRTIAQISDVHFGRVDPLIAEALRTDLCVLRPDLLVVSGDLTQRGRAWQYRAAAEYLSGLPRPQLVVPGNHDISLFAVWRRLICPLARYRRHISRDLRPFYRDDELAVLGINTAHSLTWKSGRITAEQLLDLQLRLSDLPAHLFRVVVTHHPFLPAPTQERSDVIRRAQRAVRAFEMCGVDMVLSGHLHMSYSGDIRERHATTGRSILSIHAGTATSTRRRGGEPNGYNLIRIEPHAVTIEVRTCRPPERRFLPHSTTRYERARGIWRTADAPPAEPDGSDAGMMARQ